MNGIVSTISRSAAVALAALAALALVACDDDEQIAEPSTGVISIIVSTSGGDVASDYVVRLDGDVERTVGPNGTVVYSDVEPGSHDVSLLSLPTNCGVDGTNPQAITVVANDVTRITFVVTCSSEPPTKPGGGGTEE